MDSAAREKQQPDPELSPSCLVKLLIGPECCLTIYFRRTIMQKSARLVFLAGGLLMWLGLIAGAGAGEKKKEPQALSNAPAAQAPNGFQAIHSTLEGAAPD